MAFAQVEVLEVRAWGKTVGALTPVPDSALTAFEYDPAWRASGLELSPFLMSLTGPNRVFTFAQLSSATFFGLPPLVAASMPDDFGNAVMNAALQREGLRLADIRAIDRLAYVGTRAMGALTFHPMQSPRYEPTMVEIAHLVEGARRAVHGTLDEEQRTEVLNEIISVGVSAGGARAKAIIALNPATDEVRVGGIEAPAGFEQWLIKFDGVGDDHELGKGGDYGRIEYAYWLMARKAGIHMASARLLEEGGRAHFMTKRFDRPGDAGERLHMQSLNDLRALDYRQRDAHDYGSLFETAEGLGIDAREQLFRRMVFNVLASNNDDHTKNHAFLMSEQGHWTIAPAYDLISAYNPNGAWTAHHLLGVDGEYRHITKKHLMDVADRFQVAGAHSLYNEVAEAVADFAQFAVEAGLGEQRASIIRNRLSEIEQMMD